MSWKYIGHLLGVSESKIIDEGRYYCLPCLESQKAAGAKGHISRIQTNCIIYLSYMTMLSWCHCTTCCWQAS